MNSVAAKKGQNGRNVAPNSNVREFTDDKKGGYAVGTYDNPVPEKTIREVQNTVLRNHDREVDSTMVPELEFEDQKNIIGYGIKWENNSPNVRVVEAPHVMTPNSQNSTHVTALNGQKPELPKEAKSEVSRKAQMKMKGFVGNNRGGQ